MQGQPEVIHILNQILTTELTAVHQYLLHGKMCEDWGYTRLAEKHLHESAEETSHATMLIERILFLEGKPNVQNLHQIQAGTSAIEQLRLDLDFEKAAVVDAKKAIEICFKAKDFKSQKLLEELLKDSESQIDYLEQQLKIIDDIGAEYYLAEQLK